MELTQALQHVKSGGALRRDEAHGVVAELLERHFSSWELVDFLIALAARGETPAEIAGAADAVRERMVVFQHDVPDAIVTSGTGSDGSRSFNVTLTAAIVAAAAGARVLRQGRRGPSTRCGDAELLEAAGIPIALDADRSRACFHAAGITFHEAAVAHPLLARIDPVRKALGIRTLFDYLDPVCHPGRARRLVLGVPEARRTEPLANALRELSFERAYVVSGAVGSDQFVPGCENTVQSVGDVPAWDRDADRAFRAATFEDMRGGDAHRNLEILARLLDGAPGPMRDAVVLNAAAALVVAGLATTSHDGVARADLALSSGAARATMDRWVATARGGA